VSGPFSLSDDELDAMVDTMIDAQERASSTRVLGTSGVAVLRPYVARAKEELKTKSLAAIQYETACTWTARALVAYDAGRLTEAEDFAHEAAEHAALAEMNGCAGVATLVLNALRKARRIAGATK
jgi:hypothetical protein